MIENKEKILDYYKSVYLIIQHSGLKFFDFFKCKFFSSEEKNEPLFNSNQYFVFYIKKKQEIPYFEKAEDHENLISLTIKFKEKSDSKKNQQKCNINICSLDNEELYPILTINKDFFFNTKDTFTFYRAFLFGIFLFITIRQDKLFERKDKEINLIKNKYRFPFTKNSEDKKLEKKLDGYNCFLHNHAFDEIEFKIKNFIEKKNKEEMVSYLCFLLDLNIPKEEIQELFFQQEDMSKINLDYDYTQEIYILEKNKRERLKNKKDTSQDFDYEMELNNLEKNRPKKEDNKELNIEPDYIKIDCKKILERLQRQKIKNLKEEKEFEKKIQKMDKNILHFRKEVEEKNENKESNLSVNSELERNKESQYYNFSKELKTTKKEIDVYEKEALNLKKEYEKRRRKNKKPNNYFFIFLKIIFCLCLIFFFIKFLII